MQCSVTLARKHDFGHVKMKNFNNTYNKKDTNLDIKQLCNRLQDINQDGLSGLGMPSCSIEQAEAIRRYYEAFPALEKCRDTGVPGAPRPWPAPAAPSPPPPRRRRRRAPPRRKPPEWLAAAAPWDRDQHDPVQEFIRALARHERRMPPAPEPAPVPDWDHLDADWALPDEPEPPSTPLDSQLLESFKAKFDSLEALWADPPPQPQPQPEPEPEPDRFELPIDLTRLLASPEPDAAAVTDTLRSFTAINHSRDNSGFVEVPPRALRLDFPVTFAPPTVLTASARPPPPPRDDPLTSPRTHFRPIRREDAEPRYNDGDTFQIHSELETVTFRRSASGHHYLDGELYLEYRTRAIDYDRLRLTAAQRCPEMEDDGFRLRFAVKQRDAAAQTEPAPDARPPGSRVLCDHDTAANATGFCAFDRPLTC